MGPKESNPTKTKFWKKSGDDEKACKNNPVVRVNQFNVYICFLFSELGWSQPCDVWSIGCIMFELYTGYTLFQVSHIS